MARRSVQKVESRIEDVKLAEPHVKILVYGRNGMGKTRFAATAPDVLIVDINERGTRSVRHSGAKVYKVRRWSDISDIYWYLKTADHPYKSVALDTITAMQALGMTHVLKEGEERDPNRDPKMPSQRDWGKLTELMKMQLLNFRNLDMNVIFTAQERVIGDDDELGEHVPDLSKGNRAIAMGSVEVIGRIYQKEVRTVNKKTKKEKSSWEIRMLVGPHEEYATKDRTGALGRIVRNPTVPHILEAAFSEEEE